MSEEYKCECGGTFNYEGTHYIKKAGMITDFEDIFRCNVCGKRIAYDSDNNIKDIRKAKKETELKKCECGGELKYRDREELRMGDGELVATYLVYECDKCKRLIPIKIEDDGETKTKEN